MLPEQFWNQPLVLHPLTLLWQKTTILASCGVPVIMILTVVGDWAVLYKKISAVPVPSLVIVLDCRQLRKLDYSR